MFCTAARSFDSFRPRSVAQPPRPSRTMPPVSATAGHDFGAILVSIPLLDGMADVVNTPQQGPTSPPAKAPATAAKKCDTPLSMHKVTSGKFKNSLSLDDYYPDLVGGGYWSGGADSAGTFDSGTRVGAKVQLYGIVDASCTSTDFKLEQTMTYKRFRVGGVKDSREGTNIDDIKDSGRDATKSPFRQEWTDKAGIHISMADPPSIAYAATTEIELDRDWTTSLAGPGGKKSVSWSSSIRVKAGKVTKNTVS